MVLVLLLAVVVCAFVARLLPVKIPAPILQIAAGAGLHYVGLDVPFDSHLFLLLFIPPLLFLDGWRIPKGAFFRDWKTILALAIGLVAFTVVGAGLLVHWLIPAVPLAVAFALAAILSPTDPVAVGAMTASAPLPSRLMHILEGEALLNDATGLVCFTFAVNAALTGHFSLASASLSFVLVAGGGAVVGLVVTWAIARLNHALVQRTGEDPGTQIVVSLLVPFAAYLSAEKLHVSGILAAAVAGIGMHYVELTGRALAATRMQRAAVWSTLQMILNGTIFLLQGGQLPHTLERLPAVAEATGAGSAWRLAAYVAAIGLGLLVLRFVWVWISIQLTVLRAAHRGQVREMPRTRLLVVSSIAGVRGAITLAGILTLPVLAADGSPFPARDVAIFLAMGVILWSLAVASVGLPLLTRGLGATDLPDPARGRSEAQARVAAAEAALRRIQQVLAEPEPDRDAAAARAEAARRLNDAYHFRLDYGDRAEADAAHVHRLAASERKLRLAVLAAERDELFRLRRAHIIDDEAHGRLVREIDLVEASLTPPAEAAH